jgi:TetR/AcrR family transcriptional regulator, cholesterol catabolism regulator
MAKEGRGVRKAAARQIDVPAKARPQADRKRREERWLEILTAAAEVFYEKGYEAATLQEIADRVGILKGSIYYYIKTKGDLLDSLLLEVHNEGLEMIRECAATEGSIFDKLAAMMRGHIDYMSRNQSKTSVYLHELKAIGPEHRDRLFRSHDVRDEFLALIKLGQENGLVAKNLDPKLTAQTMLGWINSLYQWYAPNRRMNTQVIADHFIFIMLRGIATQKGLKQLPSAEPQ